MIDLALGDAHVVFTDRHGGVSAAPFDTANLGDHVGDEPASVVENRNRLARSVAEQLRGVSPDPQEWVWLHQVHGADVVALDRAPSALPEADAAVTSRECLPLVVLVADCAPIALAAPGAIGVVHAGWAGLERGVIERAVTEVRGRGGDPVRAALGPCIHPASYEFGSALLARLVDRLGSAVAGRTADGRPALDVPAGVRAALRAVGVEDILDIDVNTATSPDHFSARLEGTTGRQGVVVVRTR